MATRQIIKTGTTVDDGTGDLLRDAFTKVNTNFENVWDKTSVNSNLDFTDFTITSTGDLIISPASDIKFTKSAVFNSNKGDFDFIVHGDTSDNVLFIDASTNRVGILNSTPTVALDVTGDVAVSGGLTVSGNTVLNGNTTLGNAASDIISYTGRVGTNIEPYGNVTLGTTTNRWQNGYYTNLDVTGNISGTFSGSLDPSTTVTNNINSTSIIGDTITATTSAEVGNLLVTGTLAVQGTTTTIDSATMQILDRLTFEGATSDDFETNIVATDPTADRTITLPDASGNIALFTTAPTGPIADGTNGQVLTTDGSGALSFTTAAAAGIALTDLSVVAEGSASGDGAISYDNTSGEFTYTPPDLSTYLTSVPAQTFASLTGKPTTIAGYGITDGYTNSSVDNHLNQSNPTSGYVLSWNGSDYAWVSNGSASEVNDLTASVTWANVPDANITQSSVTQHQAALSVTESQISDLGTYLTSVPAQTFASLTGKPTTIAGYGITDAFDGAYGSLTGTPTMYANSDVDTHLNQSNPTSGYVLSWNGSDYAWVANSSGGATVLILLVTQEQVV